MEYLVVTHAVITIYMAFKLWDLYGRVSYLAGVVARHVNMHNAHRFEEATPQQIKKALDTVLKGR